MFNNNNNNINYERFVRIYEKSGMSEGTRILVDKITGVHYLYSWYGYSGGITPLLDSDGKVIVSFEELEKQ